MKPAIVALSEGLDPTMAHGNELLLHAADTPFLADLGTLVELTAADEPEDLVYVVRRVASGTGDPRDDSLDLVGTGSGRAEAQA